MQRTRSSQALATRPEVPDLPVSDMAPEIPKSELRTSPPEQARPDDREQAIRERAYQRYLERGGEEGRADEDWFAAEQELTEPRT